jgi:hypothetical protein
VLGFSESSDELLILIDVSEDVISIIYVWWYNVIVCYSYTVIIHYNPIYIYMCVCVSSTWRHICGILLCYSCFNQFNQDGRKFFLLRLPHAHDSPLTRRGLWSSSWGPSCSHIFKPSAYREHRFPGSPCTKTQLGAGWCWVAAICDIWGYDAQRQSLGRESMVSAFFLGL